MRIIAGEFRGRRLLAPEGRATRPMLDRVREALFSTLGNVVEEARVLDLFAGTGSLGLEALSRGAAFVRMIESDRGARAILERNVTTLAAHESVAIDGGDALAPQSWSGAADVVFLDPPYRLVGDERTRRKVIEAAERLFTDVLAPGGVLVVHAHPRDLRAADFAHLGELDVRRYGNSGLGYLWKAHERAEPETGGEPSAEPSTDPSAQPSTQPSATTDADSDADSDVRPAAGEQA